MRKPILVHEFHGIRNTTRGGMIHQIHTSYGWCNVWAAGGVSAAVQALLDVKSKEEVERITLERGNQI